MKHTVVRTSPKGPGQTFIGTCTTCGKQGLTFATAREECENVRGLSQDDALVEVVQGPPTRGFMEELTILINQHSIENGSDTPDFVKGPLETQEKPD